LAEVASKTISTSSKWHRDQAFDAVVGGRDLQTRGAGEAVGGGVDADHGTHFEGVRQAQDLASALGWSSRPEGTSASAETSMSAKNTPKSGWSTPSCRCAAGEVRPTFRPGRGRDADQGPPGLRAGLRYIAQHQSRQGGGGALGGG
jgi:hypothetical protein